MIYVLITTLVLLPYGKLTVGPWQSPIFIGNEFLPTPKIEWHDLYMFPFLEGKYNKNDNPTITLQ